MKTYCDWPFNTWKSPCQSLRQRSHVIMQCNGGHTPAMFLSILILVFQYQLDYEGQRKNDLVIVHPQCHGYFGRDTEIRSLKKSQKSFKKLIRTLMVSYEMISRSTFHPKQILWGIESCASYQRDINTVKT